MVWILLEDIQNALDELLFRGGSLNLKLPGASGADTSCAL